jgi:hypothetical protein
MDLNYFAQYVTQEIMPFLNEILAPMVIISSVAGLMGFRYDLVMQHPNMRLRIFRNFNQVL